VRSRSRLSALLTVLVGAGIVLLAAGRTWSKATVVGLTGTGVVTTDGRSAAPGAAALALVAAAGAVVTVTSGRAVRRVVAGLLVLAGAGIVAVGVGVLADPTSAVEAAVTKATGTTGGDRAFVGHGTAWPAVSGVGGLVVALGGVVALVRGGSWSGPSQRFDRTVGDGPGEGAGPAGDAADAGEGEVTTFASGTKVTGSGADAGRKSVRSGKDRHLEAWDRLSAGEDPTD
jgi:uncharacterized membrane protein (TIGR02234 family)